MSHPTPDSSPDRMQCLQVDEWGGGLHRAEAPVPAPDPGDVLIDVEATGVGRTVANVIAGNMNDDPDDLPRIPGHEVVGRVAETGAGVDYLDPGELVTVYFHLICGHCKSCLGSMDTLCENHGGHVSAHTDGGFAEYVSLPAGNVLPIPEGIDPVAATAIPDAIATPYHVANQRAEIDRGDDVMIIGAGGGVGIHMVQMARYFGANVTAVDVVDEKLDACLDYGASHVIHAGEEHVADVGTEFDAVIDFVGDTDTLDAIPSLLGPRGRLVHLTTFPGNETTLLPRTAVSNEIAVVGSRYCSKYELLEAADLVADGAIEPVVSETVGLDGVSELLDRIVENDVLGRGAMRPA